MLHSGLRSSLSFLLAAAALGGLSGATGSATSPTGLFGAQMASHPEPYQPRARGRSRWPGRPGDKDSNGVVIGFPGSKLARKAAKGCVGLYSGRKGSYAA